MKRLVLLRHGQSTWNLENRFTGWQDVDLSDQGQNEAHEAGRLLARYDFRFDWVYTSVLKRAIRTSWITLDALDQLWAPVTKDWRLNERHYGALTGLNKAGTVRKYGSEQVHIWRRGYATPPPPMAEDDPRHPRFDPRYAGLAERLPSTESLKGTLERVIPYWQGTIIPHLQGNTTLLISAHGNSLRALIKYLDSINDEAIASVEIPTGEPLIYELADDLTVAHSYYLREAV